MAPAAKCGVCNKNVTKADQGVECDVCETWNHIACVNIPDELYTLLGKNDCISFTCLGCRDNKSDGSDLKQCLVEMERKLSDSISKSTAEFRKDQQSLRDFIETSVSDIRSNLNASLASFKTEIEHCKENIRTVENSTIANFKKLELEDNKLQRMFNRADVIISGIPKSIDCLMPPILAICKFYNIDVDCKDIDICCYIRGGSAILVKFSRVVLRDSLMRAYFKSPRIKLSDVIGGDVSARVYLSDNLTPAAYKLQLLCRMLKKTQKITWFKLLNRDVPLVKMKFPDGSEKTLNFMQCSEL